MGWKIIFAILSLGMGLVSAGILLAFMSVGTGFSEINRGFFFLLWFLFSGGLFAWMMSIRERFRLMSNRPGRMGASRAKIEAEKKRLQDPFYEPTLLGPFRPGRRKPVIPPSWGVPTEREPQTRSEDDRSG